jgi:outer membrane protein assembly factor BamB
MVNATETGIPTSWDVLNGANIKWKAQLGSQTYGNPVIAGGKIFVGTNNGREYDPDVAGDRGILVCLDEATGEFLWQAIHDKLPQGRVNDWPEQGICSTVFVEGDRVYYVSNRAEIVCADVNGMADGNQGIADEQYAGPKHADILWKLDMIGQLAVFPHNLATSSPLIVGDNLFLITSNGVDEGHLYLPSPRAPSFLAVNKNTGAVAWEHVLRNPILHGQWSSPSAGEVNGAMQIIFAAGDGWVYALDAETGAEIWKYDCNPKDSIWELGGRGTRNNIIATPVFHDNKVYVGVGQDPEHGIGPGSFHCIDATGTGDVTESGRVWRFAEHEWKGDARVFSRTISSCAIADGLLYTADLNGYVYCLDADTGELVWKYDTLAAIWGSPTVIDGKVFLGDEDGDVVIFQEGREGTKIAEINMDNSVYSTPVAANGALYVANRSELFRIETGAQWGPRR